MRGIYTAISLASMWSEYVRAATWRRAVCALAGDSCAPSRATVRERGIYTAISLASMLSGPEAEPEAGGRYDHVAEAP